MNNLVILTILLSLVIYSESNCLDTYNDRDVKEFYKFSISITHPNNSDRFKQFIETAENLLARANNIMDDNFKLNRQVRVLILYIIAICSYMHMIFYIQADSSNHCTVDFNAIDVKKIMGNFKSICQRYTDVMAHKYYLQHHLFRRTNNTTVVMQLVPVIISLQAMANVLQTIQVCSYVAGWIVSIVVTCM